MSEQKIIVILGPTASGKSALAVKTAKKFNGEVISADSRQVYTGLDLGSGKISKKEMGGIVHRLLDVANPSRRFSVAKYQELGRKAVSDMAKRGKLPIICGGTGLYIDSIINETKFPEVRPNLKLRKKLEKKSVDELYLLLKKLDPRRAEKIDRNNPIRLIRAIEIAKALGSVPRQKPAKSKYEVLKIGLKPSDNDLRNKIHTRLMSRIKNGMIDEVKRLKTKGLSWKRLESFGLEYRYLAYYLANKMNREEAFAKLETEIWRYAKRQMTWFKKDKKTKWFKPKEEQKVKNAIRNFLKKAR